MFLSFPTALSLFLLYVDESHSFYYTPNLFHIDLHFHYFLIFLFVWLYYIAPLSPLHFISYHFTTLHFISLHLFHFISFHFISFHFISLHFTSLHFTQPHFILIFSVRYIGRKPAAAAATGGYKNHVSEQKEFIDRALIFDESSSK